MPEHTLQEASATVEAEIRGFLSRWIIILNDLEHLNKRIDDPNLSSEMHKALNGLRDTYLSGETLRSAVRELVAVAEKIERAPQTANEQWAACCKAILAEASEPEQSVLSGVFARTLRKHALSAGTLNPPQ